MLNQRFEAGGWKPLPVKDWKKIREENYDSVLPLPRSGNIEFRSTKKPRKMWRGVLKKFNGSQGHDTQALGRTLAADGGRLLQPLDQEERQQLHEMEKSGGGLEVVRTEVQSGGCCRQRRPLKSRLCDPGQIMTIILSPPKTLASDTS